MKNLKRILTIIILSFMLIWVFSIVKCELSTYLYGAEFVGEYEQTNMIGGNPKPKVLKYSEEFATIYYKDDECGNVITFKKENNKWILEEWSTIWSSSGGADGFIWPYMR